MLNLAEMSTRYFRAGVGTVIYNDVGEIVIFKRAQHPIGVWELQQGGIDLGELPEETLWRELQEEVGIKKIDVETVNSMPGWTLYERAGPEDRVSVTLGQAHTWFFLKLKQASTINLSTSLEEAASEFKWTTFEHLIETGAPHKKQVYGQLKNYFKNEILK